MIDIIFHDKTGVTPYNPGQTGGFENAAGSGEIHYYRLFDGVGIMLLRLEMETYTEIRTQIGMIEINFCINGRFETSFSMRDSVLLKPGDMAGELLHPQHLKEHLADLLEWKNLTLQKVYGAKGYTLDELLAWVDKYCEAVKPYITNTTAFLRDAQKAGKSILFEAQLGALRDLDYGIYPYTTSSNAVAAYAPVGSGLPTAKLDDVVGVVKAYSSCVGEGPFVCEWFGEDAQKLRDAGAEYGAKTGRPRRVGPIDLVATRYGVEIQGATTIALTKLDILSYMDKIPVCAHYELDGQQTDEFPFPVCLQDAKPVIEYVDGWKCDISKVRSWDELPENARNYVEYVERAIGCHIGYVSVGAERDSLIIR